MRASADELSAWEALTVALVVCVDKVPSTHLTNAADLCIITGMCVTVGSILVPILARDACITWKNYAPSICLRPSSACVSGVLECMRFSRHSTSVTGNKYLHTTALRTRDFSPNPSSYDRFFIDDFIVDKIERAEAAVVEVSAQFELFFCFCFYFLLAPTKGQTTSRGYRMPISIRAAICRVHHHAKRRHLFNLPNLSSFTPSLPGLEPQTYHERKTLPSVFFFRFCPMRLTFTYD